jgi:hypothetical protein
VVYAEPSKGAIKRSLLQEKEDRCRRTGAFRRMRLFD